MGRLYVAHGDDAGLMAHRLLETIHPEKGWDKSKSVGIKPNLVVAKDWHSGATTNPAVCEAVIAYLRDKGFTNICIIESAWVGASTRDAFLICGYDALAKKYGIPLVDVKKGAYVACESGGMKIDVSKRALEMDYLINLPLVKGHCQTKMTCALKNMKGLISDREKRRFHAKGLHQPIAYLGRIIRPALTIADGTFADPDFEEGGNPVRMDTMLAGADSVLIDAYAAGMLGYRTDEIAYIRIAAELGVGSMDLDDAEIVYLGGEGQAARHTRMSRLQAVKAHISACDACSACHGNLVSALMTLDETDGLDGLTVCVGQGYKKESGDVGCGNCTAGFAHCIRGCPPAAEAIAAELKKIMDARRDR